MRRLCAILLLTVLAEVCAFGQEQRVEFTSQNGLNVISLDWSGGSMHWAVSRAGEEVIAPSRLAMTTDRGVWGENVGRVAVERKRKHGRDVGVVLRPEGEEYGVEIRAYDDGVAYRFISYVAGEYRVVDELAEFALCGDDMAWIPYVNFRPDATSDYATQFETSFENVYAYTPIKSIDWRRLIFAPIYVERGDVKLWISETNLEDYPGMFLSNRDQDALLDTEFAPLPDVVEQGGYNMLQGMVRSRKPYIAECSGERTFPWRVVAMGDSDCEIANSDLVWRLADECRIADTSWIKPGKVAWEWWNDWGLEGVDFEAGINNQTYKYYIDFASRYGIEYVILDEGWSVTGEADLMQVVPEIDIAELVAYGRERGVGIILWAGYWALQRDIEGLCRYYSEMGVQGFKVDFLDRDDQAMVRFVYELAATAAKYRLLVDYHGVYKPTGLQRTYPNAINFEGVHGLETMKWLGAEHNQISYDVTLPFIRGVAGPVDYTPGAMRNAARGEYEPNYSRPMSQGTRIHQLAMYVLYNQPLAMLCDSPTAYEAEAEYSCFLAQIPTIWREWRCTDGKIGEYIVAEGVTDGASYVAGLNGNAPREVTISLSNRDIETCVEVFSDSVAEEANRPAYEYKRIDKESLPEQLTVRMEAGGGFVIKLN